MDAVHRRTVEQRNGQMPTATGGYAVETIKSVLIPMSRTFAYAKRHLGFGGENVVSALDLDERPGYKQHKPKKKKFGRDELDRLIEAAETPWREIIGTAIGLGTRIGETLGLRWRDIDAGIITVAQQANAKRQIARLKTETAYRRIEAPEWLMTMFREQSSGRRSAVTTISSSALRLSRTVTATCWVEGYIRRRNALACPARRSTASGTATLPCGSRTEAM